MALKEYLGAIVMEIDGQEVEIESLNEAHKTGRKRVKTMNKTGRSPGFAKGVEEIDLQISAVIPLEGDIDWAKIQGAKIVIYPVSEGGKREVFYDCFTVDVGAKYTTDNEAMRDLSMVALRKGFE